MTLWRVDVCGVSHRFVEADSSEEAKALVREAFIAALALTAAPANATISKAYESATSVQKRNLLARIDGLVNPRERASAKSAIERLERLIEFSEREQEWIKTQVEGAPPMSPETAAKIARLMEIDHVEDNFRKLPDWDPKSPIHGGRP
jgi:hypothetical protein